MRWSPFYGLLDIPPAVERTQRPHPRIRRQHDLLRHGGRCVSRTSRRPTSDRRRAANGKRLNSPNDVVVKSDGTIWFTDPPYGIITATTKAIKAESEIGKNQVYRFDPKSNEVTVVADDFAPARTGWRSRPDESEIFYIADFRAMRGAAACSTTNIPAMSARSRSSMERLGVLTPTSDQEGGGAR